MSDLYNNIAFLCSQHGISVGKMCNELKISRGNLTELKMGRIQTLKIVNLQKISSFFGITVDELMGELQKEKPATGDGGESLTESENEIVCSLKKLNEAGQLKVKEYADDLVQSGKYLADNMIVIPVAARSGGKHQIIGTKEELDKVFSQLIPSKEKDL